MSVPQFDSPKPTSSGSFSYTVGNTTVGGGWYIRIPWHLRGAAAELIAQFRSVNELPDGCIGVEYWDGHVQFERHAFPWIGNE